MLQDGRTVTVGREVHKSSVRLAAVSRGEMLRERNLVYDHDELLGEIVRGRGRVSVRRRGRRGSGCTGRCWRRGSTV
jgi:hypothetical protein